MLSRTIYAIVSHYNSVGFLPAGAQLTGYRTFRTYGVSIPSSCFNNTIDGTTGDGNTSGGYNAAAYGCTCKNSVSYNAANVLTGQTNYNSGNIGYYANVHSDSGSLCVNCVITNSGTSRAILSTAVGSQMVNPIGRYGPIYYSIGGGSTIIVGARTAGTYNDIYLGAAGSSNVYCYNCVLGQSTPCTGYNSGWRPAQAAVQSYNQSGTAGSYYLWCRGGIATTNQSTQVYGTDTYGTMKFTIDGTINNSPIVWDTWFYMPGTNRSLTFNVPMYAASTDGITAAVWIVDPTNDPLVYRTFPVTAATWVPSTPTVGTAIGNVLAIAYPTFTASPGWQNVNITVPAQASPGKELICRVIFTGSIPGKIGYAYISNMEKMLMITRQRFA